MTQTLTLELPSGLYAHIQKRAEQANRSMEEVLLELLAKTLPPADDAPADLQQTLAALELLEDPAIERAAQSHLAEGLAVELEGLHLKQQREGLTQVELARCAELVRAYERAMLIRAHAVALLQRRGIDIGRLVTAP